jgi:hypothetical protein
MREANRFPESKDPFHLCAAKIASGNSLRALDVERKHWGRNRESQLWGKRAAI